MNLYEKHKTAALILLNDKEKNKVRIEKALKTLEECCNNDYIPSLDLMGDLYFFGIKVEQSFEKAFKYHARSSELGSEYANDIVGNIKKE